MSVDAADEEFVEAELVEDGELVRATPAPRLLVNQHTALMPGEAIPTSDNPRTTYTERDVYYSEETAQAIKDAEAEESPQRRTAMRLFEDWCAEQKQVAKPCTTKTYTEYGHHLMSRGLKVTTIRHYMSLIRTSMPAGERPDPSVYLLLLRHYRKKNKRALRRKEAFPITLSYLVPMMKKAEADDRPIGWRDSAMLAFGYRFLGRSIEDVDLDLEDLTILDDMVTVWLAEDKTHKGEEQTIYLHDREDLRLVFRMRRWVDYLASQGITTGPVFREVKRNGTVASSETRAKTATKRGDHLRPQTVNERVKLWFAAAGLKTDGRPVSSHSLRAGGATDLGVNGATDEELEAAGRWKKGSRIPRERYVRPTKSAAKDLFKKVPMHNPEAQAQE
ncbi:tyrosine-type recombinase/integrase [Streptomyces sp. SP18BB07]|uniref:tyrosine-type recombinase/integrase n=1 Tax=Streptomyces sp. SP18BB07 TaxID=3002522 RepID=UPI002E7865AC|nr:tyrosine-type recombinase/integrase [Streptomyces sp. SP18BB07]MEE1764366.1 tyrosine-type recombinase/integrase [Streptomyces sp. SP18BB07]